MSQFYKAETKFLDMSNFLEKQDGPGVGLKKFFISQKTIGSAICKIIGANIPEVSECPLNLQLLLVAYVTDGSFFASFQDTLAILAF